MSDGRSPWLTDELAAVAELARTFFAKEVVPQAARFDEQGHPDRDLYRRAGELGLLGMSVPERYGGGGGTFAADAAVITEQARSGDTSLHLGVHNGIVIPYLLAYASEAGKRRWLPRLCSGEWVGAIAMTEPGAGSDLQAIATTARRDGDHYVISGGKTFISNGHLCDLVIIAANTGSGPGAAGISLLVAEVADGPPGFERGRILRKIGQHGQDTAELFFDGLRVPADNLLGGVEGRGFAQLAAQLPQERLIAAIGAVGVMERAVELATEHTKRRIAFGKPLFAMQHTRFELAECATLARIGRVFVDDCVLRHLRGELDVATAAMAKYWLTDQQCTVVDRCLQLFGGYGYMMEYPIARLYADSRVQRIYAGANEVMKELIARTL